MRVGSLFGASPLVTNVRTLFRDFDNVFVHACEYMVARYSPDTTSKIHSCRDHEIATCLHKVSRLLLAFEKG
jgi:hypothetical protein